MCITATQMEQFLKTIEANFYQSANMLTIYAETGPVHWIWEAPAWCLLL